MPTVDDPSKCDARFTSNHNLKCNYVSGINWTRIDNSSLPGRFPTSLSFAPDSNSKLYVTFSGFSVTTPGRSGHVFVTNNLTTTPGATAWTNLNGTGVTALPDLPFSSIVVNPHSPAHLYTAGDVGVFFSPDSGKHWLRIDNGLPKVPIYQLDYDPTTRTLLAGTHGRANLAR